MKPLAIGVVIIGLTACGLLGMWLTYTHVCDTQQVLDTLHRSASVDSNDRFNALQGRYIQTYGEYMWDTLLGSASRAIWIKAIAGLLCLGGAILLFVRLPLSKARVQIAAVVFTIGMLLCLSVGLTDIVQPRLFVRIPQFGTLAVANESFQSANLRLYELAHGALRAISFVSSATLGIGAILLLRRCPSGKPA